MVHPGEIPLWYTLWYTQVGYPWYTLWYTLRYTLGMRRIELSFLPVNEAQ